MAAAGQFDVFRARDFVGDRLVERGRRGLVELAAYDQRRHGQSMQHRLEIGLLQNFAGVLERLGIDFEQNFFTLFDRFRMRRQITGREHALGGDFGNRAEPALGHFGGHDFELLLAVVGKAGGGIAEQQFGNTFGMREREGQRQRAAKAIADEDGVIGDAEFLEAVLDHRYIGVDERQQAGLRAVKARQIDQRDAMLGR